MILHYKVADVTEKCVDCLLQQKYEKFHVIILDNASDNGSFEYLCSKYKGYENVELLALERNFGFAKANDVGYIIAKHKYNADMIVIMNNDVMITDFSFCKKLDEYSKKEEFDIMGPDIVNLDGRHQNPNRQCVIGKNAVSKAIFVTRCKLAANVLLHGIIRGRKTGVIANAQQNSKEEQNVPLHGSCLIFNKSFIEQHEFAFYPETFLYGEEEILYYFAQREGLKLLYQPQLSVCHQEDAATNSVLSSRKEKRIFELKHSLKSLKILRNLMRE